MTTRAAMDSPQDWAKRTIASSSETELRSIAFRLGREIGKPAMANALAEALIEELGRGAGDVVDRRKKP